MATTKRTIIAHVNVLSVHGDRVLWNLIKVEGAPDDYREDWLMDDVGDAVFAVARIANIEPGELIVAV